MLYKPPQRNRCVLIVVITDTVIVLLDFNVSVSVDLQASMGAVKVCIIMVYMIRTHDQILEQDKAKEHMLNPKAVDFQRDMSYLRLLRKALIHALCNKILGWSKSELCA